MNNEETEPAETEKIPEELVIVEDGEALYAVVRPELTDDENVELAVSVRRGLEEKTGVQFTLGTDWVKRGDAPDMEKPEILVGVTNRTTEEEIGSLGWADWTIKAEGNKIFLLARSVRALGSAVEAFLSDEVTAMDGGRLLIRGLPISGSITLAAGEVPDYPHGDFVGMYESSGSTVIFRYENTTAENFADYLGILKDAGFELYDEHMIENNRFATCVNDVTTVNCSWFERTGTTRVICEERSTLCPLEDPYEEKYETLLTGMKGETVVASEGMGFIIRLADGSFCIIDGGMGDPNSVDSNKLMNILNEQKPEDVEKPVIAAWIFSHMHGDHIGVFNCFSLDHHDDVVIEKLIYNFPKEEEVKVSDSPYMLDDTIYRFTAFKKNLANYYSDVPILKVHSGNRFEVRNAHFEVLYAYDDLYPKTILDGGMNENSLLLKMTIGSQTTLWTGDFAFIATDLVLSEYSAETLECDILQVAHHGINGTVDFYSRVNPTYVLWPVWAGGFESMRNNAQNKWLIDSEKVRHVIVTGVGTWTIRLPYDPVDGTFDRTPTWKTKHPPYPALLGE